MKIKINFQRYSDSDLETKAGFILQSMTGNAHFPSPIPTLAELQAALTAYSNALVKAEDLGRLNVAEKRQARKQLELLLGQLGMYVMYIATGDEVVLTSSGYDMAKEAEPSVIVNPGNVSVGNGYSTGEMRAWVKAVPGAKSYIHQIAADPITPDTVWQSNTSSRSKMLYSNLQPGTRYWVRIAAVGANDQTTYSPLSSMYVQ